MRHALLAAVALAACSGSSAKTHEPTPLDDHGQHPVAPAAPMTLADSGIVPEWLDRTAEPCQDFYRYACGGFVDHATIPADRSSWSAITVVTQGNEEFLKGLLEKAAADPGTDPVAKKLGDFYAACMDEDAIEKAGLAPLAKLRATIATVKDAASAAKAVTALHAAGVFALFSTWPTQDFGDATQVIAGLDQAGLGLPDRKYYLEDKGNLKAVRTAYQGHLVRMFGLLGDDAAAAKAAAADVMRIETALAKLQQDEVVRRDPHAVYHKLDRAGLDKIAKSFPWTDYFTGIGIPATATLTVNDPTYFTGVTRLLGKEKPAALRTYLTWMVVHDAAPTLGKAFVAENFELEKVLSGTEALPPRWRRCVQRVDGNLGELLGQPYVAARFAGHAKADAIAMTQAVLGTMAHELDALPWMDAATRTAAQAKRAKMGYLVGYPDTWRVYDFAVSRTDHAGNVAAATRFELARQLAKIGKPVDRNDWQMTPPTVNAYYDPTLNELALPAGQLQPPFFGASFHPAVNFGSTGGGTIGHEMTHGFDDEGSQFDADGNLKNWWSEATAKQFAAATQCVVTQFGGYEAVPGIHLDGKLTVGENIADIGGVKIGYQAYQEWKAAQATPPPAAVDGLSDGQLYFLAYAQSWCAKVRPESLETMAHTNPHSPPEWRVKGVVIDQPGFAEAYQCKAGSPMNPGNACVVW